MYAKLSILKGLHPGAFLERELHKRGLKKGPFALSIGEYPQTFGAILLGKRNMNPALAMKVEEKLDLDEGFLMCLQALYEMKQAKAKISSPSPDLSIFRPVLFWDTELHKINWQKNRNSVIKRVLERGNEKEKKELEKFYKISLNPIELG